MKERLEIITQRGSGQLKLGPIELKMGWFAGVGLYTNGQAPAYFIFSL